LPRSITALIHCLSWGNCG